MTARKKYLSNTMLLIGLVALFAFAGLELVGSGTDPLVPAVSALCIGCTAVLDRLGPAEEFEEG